MYPTDLHKIPNETICLSRVLDIWILRKQPKANNKLTKTVNEKTIGGLQQCCLKQDKDFLSWLLSSETIFPDE